MDSSVAADRCWACGLAQMSLTLIECPHAYCVQFQLTESDRTRPMPPQKDGFSCGFVMLMVLIGPCPSKFRVAWTPPQKSGTVTARHRRNPSLQLHCRHSTLVDHAGRASVFTVISCSGLDLYRTARSKTYRHRRGRLSCDEKFITWLRF